MSNNSHTKDDEKWQEQNSKRFKEENANVRSEHTNGTLPNKQFHPVQNEGGNAPYYANQGDSSNCKKPYYPHMGDGTVHNKMFYDPQAHGLIPVGRMQEQMQDKMYPNNINSPKIPVPEDAEVCDAMAFLNRIRDEFSEDLVSYDNFLETMRDYKFGKIDADEVCKGVRILFKDKPQLVETFNEYLPIHLKYFPDNRMNENMNRGFDRMHISNQQQAMRRGGYNMKMMPPNANPNGLGHNNIRGMIPKMGAPPIIHQPQHPQHMPRGLLPGMIPGYIPPQSMQHPCPPPVHMRMPPGANFNPMYHSMNMPPKTEEEMLKKRKANEYIQRVKKNYANQPAVYKAFVDILQKFTPESDIVAVRSEVSSLLWEHTDLIEDFETNFIAAEKQRQEEKSVFNKLCKDLYDKNVLNEFLRCINYFNQNFITKRELLLMVTPLLKTETQIGVFKKYVDVKEKPEKEGMKKLENCKKIGSYRILTNPIQNPNQEAIAKDVLNTTCVSCPTFDSEDGTFVFLKRNMYEDILFRIEDDRSEASLVIERLDYLITSLEVLYSSLETAELSIQDLGMSPGIVKDILQNIYDDAAAEVLDGILLHPKAAIPVLIKRLYSVNNEHREKLRQKHKVWNEQTDRAFYKALDTNGPHYKNIEKNSFSTKVLVQEFNDGFEQKFDDSELLQQLYQVFILFVKTNQQDNKKAPVPDLFPTIDLIFSMFFSDKEFIADYNVFCVYRFIAYIYKKLLDIKKLDLNPLISSSVAVTMNIIPEYSIEDRLGELLNTIKGHIEKTIDPVDYEESVKVLTNCQGYKLYNIKKIFLKIEKAILVVIDTESSLSYLTNNTKQAYDDECAFVSFAHNAFKAKRISLDTTSDESTNTEVSNKVKPDESTIAQECESSCDDTANTDQQNIYTNVDDVPAYHSEQDEC